MKTETRGLAAVAAILFVWYWLSVVPFTIVNRSSREPAFPVDAVYTWVDSSDVNWQHDVMQRQGVGDKRPVRFPSARHADTELKLSMAMADKHMPWLRYIFIVVARPQYCDWWADYPKIRVVYHDELVSVGLPTFNSFAIELFLHRIFGLAEHFVYFKDDFYVLRPVPKSAFFDSKGGFYSLTETIAPRFQVPYLAWYVFGDPYMLAQLRLANELGYVRKLNRLHVPCAMTKSGLRRALKRWPKWARQTLLRPFRSPDDFPAFEAAINMNGRVLKDGPKSMYTSNRMVFTASAIKDVTFAVFNNPRTEEDYQTIQRVLRLRLGHGDYKRRRRSSVDSRAMQPHLVVPGPTINEMCEAVYQYTLENPTGDVFVDLDAFDDLGVSKILCLISELRAVERFANPDFEGKLTVFNASWVLGNAISAVYNTVIYRSAPKATFKLA